MVLASAVNISETAVTLLNKQTKQLTATVTPDNADDKTIVWSSSSDAVASVSNTGLVSAIGAGTAVITATNTASGKKATSTITVVDDVFATTQAELEYALNNGRVGTITVQPAAGVNMVIPSGDYSGTKLVVWAGYGTITNNGKFDSITVNGGTYNENAAGSKITVVSPAKIVVGSGASLDVTVGLSGNTSSGEVVLENNGTISNVEVKSPGTVSISGKSSSDTPIDVKISSANVTVKSNQNLAVDATAKASLILTGSTSQTTVAVNTEANLPEITGLGFIPYTIKDTNKTGAIAVESSQDLGPVDIQGTVVDAYTGKEIKNVNVYLIAYKDYSKEMELPGTVAKETTTNSNGVYSFKQAKSGIYYMVMRKDGYKDAIQLLTASAQFNSVYENETMELIDLSKPDNGNATIEGMVKDAGNGQAISGITVELRGNKGNVVDSLISTVTTGSDGKYNFSNLKSDQYTLYFKDNRTGETEKFISNIKNVCVKADVNNVTDMTLSKPVFGFGIRFVLTWGSVPEGEGSSDTIPEDLDAHLFAPTPSGTYTEISYENRYYEQDGKEYVQLDVDDMDYAGPETITIKEDVQGIYYLCIFNYSGKPYFPTSQAHVDVYSENTLLTSYNVPAQGGDERWWKVCSYDSATGRITSYNKLMNELDMDNPVLCRYVKSVSGADYVTDFEESHDSLTVYYDYNSDPSWEDIKFTYEDGYTGTVNNTDAYGDSYDDSLYLHIMNSSGEEIACRRLSFDYTD